MNVKRLVILSILTTILFVVEQALSFIPNVQLTFLLIIIYSKSLKLKESLIIILIHVILDNLFMGSFNIVYVPFMYIGYSVIPVTLKFLKIEKEITISLFSILFSFLYCLLFVIPSVMITGINFVDYLIADIPFTILLSISSFISVLWLYKPLKNKLDELINKNSSI